MNRVNENACGSKEFDLPLSRFPLRGKAGAGGFPPRRQHAARPAKSAGTHRCAGSPHKRAAAPLWIPCERGNAGLATLRDNREVRTHALAEIGRRWRIVYTKYLTLPIWANYSSEGDTPPGMVIRPRLIRVGAPH